MNLSAPPIRSPRTVSLHGNFPATSPGYVNPNRQSVIAPTGARSTSRLGQTIYHLRCGDCGHDYGCNGLDIKARFYPKCQGGAHGEPLREHPPGSLESWIERRHGTDRCIAWCRNLFAAPRVE